MTDRLARGCLVGRRATEHGKCRLGPEALWVVAGGDEEGTGDVGPHTEGLDQFRGGLGGELGELSVERTDLGLEGLAAAGQGTQGRLVRRCRRGVPAWAQAGGGGN
jgi:hypothetical protein